jgi:molybdate transport repressor ModE-like protein
MNTSRVPDPMGTIDSTELRILHALSSTGSLTAAAAQLGLSQPAVSQRLKRVESRLAVPLIERQGRGIRLTPAGRILADHGRTVVAEIDAAIAAIEDLRGDRGGVLRLVGFPSASATIVPTMMARLTAEAPEVAFQYREAEPPEAIAMLRDGEVDCALVFEYGGEPLPSACHFTPLWREELQLVVTEQRSGGAETANIADFDSDHWIAGCTKCRGHLMAVAGECGFEPDIIQETDNVPAMIAMVDAGGAVALVPGLALAAARSLPPGTRALPLSEPRFRTIGLVSVSTANESPSVRLAKRLLSEIDGSCWGLISAASGARR